jgi:hypothetical protein
MSSSKLYPDQIVPLALTFVVCLFFVGVLFLEVTTLNHFVGAREPISTVVFLSEVLVGMTIYLKTSIDFAIFIGRLMSEYVGWKNRVMIEIGTAAGNALGTLGILAIWDLFREIKILMAVMIFVAALVLIRMAEDGLSHARKSGTYPFNFFGWINIFEKVMHTVNGVTKPFLSHIVPDISVKEKKSASYKKLFMYALTVPFILGLDDFAGYIPLFNVVNVYGFAIGVFVGHMILNIFLFLSPKNTIRAVKNPIISLIGSVAFVGLALWGIYEALHLFL